MASQIVQSPPYRPTTWSLGGKSEKSVDIPITAAFLVLFIISAIWHMTIFQRNRRRKHKFVFNGVLFGFSMARITTCIMRIASTSLPSNIRLAIAANIFVAAGVLLVFIINLLWAKRILRALHPTIGWHRATSIVFNILYVLIFITLAMTITAVVQSFYTLRPRTRFIDRAVQLYAQTLLATVSSLPIFMVGLALLLPRRSQPEQFGAGKLSYKLAILLAGSGLVSLGAWYRCGTFWMTPVPMSQSLPGYFAKPCFYMFVFGVEILTLYLYAIMRVDLRFHVPDGAKGPGSYEARVVAEEADIVERGDEEAGVGMTMGSLGKEDKS